jgi:hypothetical protein
MSCRLSYPVYVVITLNNAVAYSLLDVAEPANELGKLAYGSFTLNTRPLSTTQPVTTVNKSRMTLITPISFMPRTPHLGRNVRGEVIDTLTAIAIPRSSHTEALFPAAMTMFDAKAIKPEARRPG